MVREGAAMKTHRLLIAILCLLAFSGKAYSQLDSMGQPLPAGEMPQNKSTERPDLETVPLDGLSGKAILGSLRRGFADQGSLQTRGAKDIEIYRTLSPSVVVVITDTGLGSGSYLGSGRVLTNWHVVAGKKTVGIAFKPAREGDKVTEANIVKGEVVRTDPVKDLALVRVVPPQQDVRPIELGSEADIQIGADVHAIGHPTGQVWTYTRGLISQFRRAHAWAAKSAGAGPEEKASTHRADVVQTQTPINPGNSGGPLLSESGRLLGVNTFKAEGENLNFAVAVEEVQDFLNRQGAPAGKRSAADDKTECVPVELYSGRNKKNTGHLVQFATQCDGFADFSIFKPDDPKLPIQALLDSNHDGKIDILVEDRERRGRWVISFHDVNYDGTIDLVGYHPDGKLKPSRFEKYEPSRSY
jgi:S1-C subfamily serine protease